MRRILEFTGREPSAHSVDWAAVEEELRVPLPADFKQLCEVLGGGTFCDSVSFLGRAEGSHFNFLLRWRAPLSLRLPADSGQYQEYTPGGKGYITWASTEWGTEYCWLVDAQQPGACPVLARGEAGEWCEYDMSTSEFLYRVLADKDFRPFGIARYDLDPTFRPGPGAHGG
ncbi:MULTISPECIES: SMI1/KNR4 family protein [unclassified Streptomyces]|uniref:SMI1/KNR4 family protein n=1 Tax=unclassified Streptomyces TaxID=2593676 RepID=UPI0037022071